MWIPGAAARGRSLLTQTGIRQEGVHLPGIDDWAVESGDLALPIHSPALRDLFLPSMRKKPAADGSNPEGDFLQEHWLVDDMFTFENVGFTKDVGNIKFLVCADCEIGPIGWHCLDDKNSFYVALERVSHE